MNTASNRYTKEYRFEYTGTLAALKEGLGKATEKKWYNVQKAFTEKGIQNITNDATGISTIRIYQDNTAEFRLDEAKITRAVWEKTIVETTITKLIDLGAKKFKPIS